MRGENENSTKAPRRCGISLFFPVFANEATFFFSQLIISCLFLCCLKRKSTELVHGARARSSRFAIGSGVSFSVVRGEGNTATTGIQTTTDTVLVPL